MTRKYLLIWIGLCAAVTATGQQVTMLVAPLRSTSAGDAEIGKKTGLILNLQIWQTLRIPPAGAGRDSKGGIVWDVTSKSPATYAEADELAKRTEPAPQLVLWGRTSRYGSGNVVEPFLLIRSEAITRTASSLWSVKFGETSFAVDIVRRQIDFAPIVLRADLLPELKDPAGLMLYTLPSGGQALGPVGDSFRALVQDRDAAKVVTPDRKSGWLHLPRLSNKPSEVVNFCGAMIRLLRQDWQGATALFQQVVANPNTPPAVKADSYLYLAVAADRIGEDTYPWVRKAYELDPYSKITIEYVCMSHLSALARMPPAGRQSAAARQRVQALAAIANQSRPLFPPQDAWFIKLQGFLSRER